MTCGSLLPLFLFESPVSPFANQEQPKTRPLESIGYELQICKPFVLIFRQIGGGGRCILLDSRTVVSFHSVNILLNEVECRVLFPERPRQRLQSEIEPRSGHESRRSRRPPGFAFPRRAIPRPLRQRLGQPRHQVRASAPGDIQFLSSRGRHSLRLVAARTANSRRTSHARRAHASLRRLERRAIQLATFDEARAFARQSSTAPAWHQRVSLRASLVRRRGGIRVKARNTGNLECELRGRRTHRPSGERGG